MARKTTPQPAVPQLTPQEVRWLYSATCGYQAHGPSLDMLAGIRAKLRQQIMAAKLAPKPLEGESFDAALGREVLEDLNGLERGALHRPSTARE